MADNVSIELWMDRRQRISAFHVTENGTDMHFKTDRGYEFLEATHKCAMRCRSSCGGRWPDPGNELYAERS
jgi:hypothetical protein